MEPIENSYNNKSKLIDIKSINQISLNDKLDEDTITNYGNLSITELKSLLTQKNDTIEILKVKSLIKDKSIKEFKNKINSGEITITKDNYKNYTPCLLEEKKVSDQFKQSRNINAGAKLSSDFNVFNNQFSGNLKPGSIINTTGKKGLTLSCNGSGSGKDNSNIIIGKVKEYDTFDWIGLYDHNNSNNSNYIKFWWSCNYETEINTNISRDKNKTYYTKYFKYDSSEGKYQVIDESVLPGEDVWIKIEGGKDEYIKLKWSNSDSASSSSYVALYSKPSGEPSNSNNYIVRAYQYANKDNGIYSTSIINNGSSYYAALWCYSSDDYFIKLSSDLINQ